MATWSKVKQQMESFLAPTLSGVVQYSSGSYRYSKEKQGQCYLKAEGMEVFSVNKSMDDIFWCKTEQELKKMQNVECRVTEVEIEAFHQAKPMIPLERVQVILKEQKENDCRKRIIDTQNQLWKSDFMTEATKYLASSVDKSLESDNILAQVFAIIDRRMGKSRLRKLKDEIDQKHSVVKYFYQLRCKAEGIL